MPDVEVTIYQIMFDDGAAREFRVELQRPSLGLVPGPSAEQPEWTRLGFHKCSNCPLREEDHPRCPVARNLVPVNDAFCDRVSHEQVNVLVRTEARTYQKTCALQEAVSSLMGLIMATSGCPPLDRLRPMVFTHLPFPTGEQTTYRAVSMYLLAQFFRRQRGEVPDWELKDLSRAYEDIRTVNRAFAARLAAAQTEDANLNAIVRLDSQASMMSFSIAEHWWEEIEPIFRPHRAGQAGEAVNPDPSATGSAGR